MPSWVWHYFLLLKKMNNLTRWETYSPISIGFEDMFRRLDAIADNPISNYPPYNRVKLDENREQLQLALAGHVKEDIQVAIERKVLNISVSKTQEEVGEFVHKGIARRTFSRNWQLSSDTVVEEVTFVNGLLCVNLKREVPLEEQRKVLPIS